MKRGFTIRRPRSTPLVVLLAAVVTIVVLGANGAADDGGAEMEFSFEFVSDVVRAKQLLVAGAASEPGRAAFGPVSDSAPDAKIESGDTSTVWMESDDSVSII